MSKTSAERRRAKRVPARVPVRVTRPGASSQQAESRDLTRNGLFFFLGEPMAEGTAIELGSMRPTKWPAPAGRGACGRGRALRGEGPPRRGALALAPPPDALRRPPQPRR